MEPIPSTKGYPTKDRKLV